VHCNTVFIWGEARDLCSVVWWLFLGGEQEAVCHGGQCIWECAQSGVTGVVPVAVGCRRCYGLVAVVGQGYQEC